jgi:ribonucleoside-diphosphate reductase alpha chain
MSKQILNKNSEIIIKARYLDESENNWSDKIEKIIREINKIDKDEEFNVNCRSALEDMNFIPGGRILRNLGRIKGSTMNCNVLPIGDSIEEIGSCFKNSLIIWSFGGGIGINFSPLRPKGTNMVTKGGTASGLVSFLKAIDSLAATIETGGQRRAAGMAVCDISHPEIMDFIDVKLQDGLISYFNLSVAVNDRFLEAVEKKDKWNLTFGGKIYNTVDANMLWNKILNNMVKSAEPGLIHWGNLVKNNTYYFSPIVSTNPCGEIPLPNFGSCCLGSINLENMLSGVQTNWKKLGDTIKVGVRFLDNIIDINYYPLQELATESLNSRRIGLGVMGLANYLVKKGIKYGSEKCLVELDKLFKFIRDKAYESSIELAGIKSVFPMFDRVKYGKASFIRKLPAKIRIAIKEYGIRNASILTCAPTGTISLIPNTSSGIEPIPYKAYRRCDRVGERIYIHSIYKKCLLEGKKDDSLVDILDLKPEDHFEVQATIQKYIDSSISKTINLPKEATSKDLNKLLLEYIHDLKGVTVYRDESRKGQIINRLSEEEALKCLKEEEEKITDKLSKQDVKCAKGVCEI